MGFTKKHTSFLTFASSISTMMFVVFIILFNNLNTKIKTIENNILVSTSKVTSIRKSTDSLMVIYNNIMQINKRTNFEWTASEKNYKKKHKDILKDKDDLTILPLNAETVDTFNRNLTLSKPLFDLKPINKYNKYKSNISSDYLSNHVIGKFVAFSRQEKLPHCVLIVKTLKEDFNSISASSIYNTPYIGVKIDVKFNESTTIDAFDESKSFLGVLLINPSFTVYNYHEDEARRYLFPRKPLASLKSNLSKKIMYASFADTTKIRSANHLKSIYDKDETRTKFTSTYFVITVDHLKALLRRGKPTEELIYSILNIISYLPRSAAKTELSELLYKENLVTKEKIKQIVDY